ncbi:MAG: hypothetical protein WKG00_03435 [Polyangiaceae bacterium]
MKTPILLATFALLTAACSSSEQPITPDPTTSGTSSGGEGGGPPGDTSGDRLRARRLAADDGASQFLGWRDTERDEDCTFRKAADGKMRCLTDVPVIAAQAYEDAACTIPLLNNATGCIAEGSVVLVQAQACDLGLQVWKTGAKFTGATRYYFDVANSCVPKDTQEYDNFATLASQVDASSFVAAKVQVD